jgi:hypothetical protein
MCPAGGNRRATVVFEPPSNAQVGTTYLPRPVSERVRIPDLRGEEFEETIGGARGGDGSKLVHASTAIRWDSRSSFR